VRDRKCFETPTPFLQNRAWGDCSQPVSAVVLGSDRIGEIAPDERDRLITTDDLDGAIHLIKSKRSEEAGQTENMIKMSVRQQHVRRAPEPNPRAHQLPLGAFTAIDQVPAGPLCDKRCR
jgi:hypothetical protein